MTYEELIQRDHIRRWLRNWLKLVPLAEFERAYARGHVDGWTAGYDADVDQRGTHGSDDEEAA